MAQKNTPKPINDKSLKFLQSKKIVKRVVDAHCSPAGSEAASNRISSLFEKNAGFDLSSLLS